MARPRKLSLPQRFTRAVRTFRQKDFIPPLSAFDESFDGNGLQDYRTKAEQLSANIGWCYTANSAIADACASVEIKLYRKTKKGDREEVTDHEILGLIDQPNLALTGEQMRQLHFTYMNFVGEGYLWMIERGDNFEPRKGRLPEALQTLPAHETDFKLGTVFTNSLVKHGQDEYPVMSVVRDLNPDPKNFYRGRSVIAASAAAIDTEEQMKAWNRRLFANGAHPSLIFSSKETMDDEVYERWKQQFADNHTGTDNAFKPLLIEGGDAKPFMLNQQDLDFLNSRKFSRDEILAMWRVSPGILGLVENVNRANLEAGFYIHALVNTVPRMRQFVRQLNAAFVTTYDPLMELDFANPVPEDRELKLREATEGVNKIYSFNEVREMYGKEPLADGLGDQFFVPSTSATLADVVSGAARPTPFSLKPADDDTDDDKTKAHRGVKKNP